MLRTSADPNPADPAAELINTDADPFADWVFRDLWQPPFCVGELNDAALKRLLTRFDRLVAGPLPRPGRRLDHAQLIASPQPGYGKSHLLGRVCGTLKGHATLVSVAPFHSPGLCWQSVLRCVMQELTLPDRKPQDAAPDLSTAAIAPDDDTPTQLDAFAHGVLAHLMAGLIESGRARHPDPAGAAAWLREHPLEAFTLADPAHPGTPWLREAFDLFHRDMEGALHRAGLSLHSSGWLRVLFRYAASGPEEEARDHCLAWLNGQALESASAAVIGLRAGAQTPAETSDQINDVCWRRLLDFCQLAAFYRPFVFCFDGIESYGQSPALARCFGMVIAQMHLLAANQMMVITANQQPWEETVAFHMEAADRDRFSPLPLEGIRRVQAVELVRRRCRQHDVPAAQVEAFLEPDWLAAYFPTERNRWSTRQFLQACSARWQQPQEWWQGNMFTTPEPPFDPAVLPPVPPSSPELPPVPSPVVLSVVKRNETPSAISSVGTPELIIPLTPTMDELSLGEWHECYTADLKGRPERLLYQADTFSWLVTDVASGREGLTIAAPSEGPLGYLPVTWNLAAPGQSGPASQVLFGFETGDNWRRWRSILREVQDRCLPPPLSSVGPISTTCKAVFLRTSEQAALPAPGWEIAAELESAKKTCFDVIELEPASVVALYAGRALYTDAVVGEVPYSARQVLDFLRTEFQPLWERIQKPMPGEPPPVLSGAAVAFT